LLDDHHRAVGEARDLVRYRSQERALELRQAAAPHHDGIDSCAVSVLDDRSSWLSLPEYRLNLLEALGILLDPDIVDDALGRLIKCRKVVSRQMLRLQISLELVREIEFPRYVQERQICAVGSCQLDGHGSRLGGVLGAIDGGEDALEHRRS